MDLITAARDGYATIDAAPEIREAALKNLTQWLAGADTAEYGPQIEWLIAQQKWSLLLDSFYQVLPFGTGGRRGGVGVGPNRMNLWTLGASVQGHCDYLRQRFPRNSNLQVVLAYDVRRYMDTKKLYNPDLPNPVMGLTSRNFCEYAAGVYVGNGITPHILPADTSRYVATPELSYTIRYLKAHGGLNMTASHNPPDDNGSKFYDERGAQPVPPEDQIMSDYVDQVAHVRATPYDDAVRQGKVQFLTDAPHAAYIEVCKKQSLVPPPKANEVKVVFTPLQGVGGFCAGEVLTACGFNPIAVPGQETPDGQFPNVTSTPNPENPECLDRAREVAEATGADLVIATDPDADRVGGLARGDNGELRFLTGQEIATLLTWFKLSRLASAGDLPASPVVITTEVTTGQITRICRHFNAQVVNDLLVGFKYHADVLWQLESEGHSGEVTGNPADFVIATEESHGILATAEMRDKDAGCAALLMAELALHLKRQSRTIPGLLEDLARQFGYYRNELQNLVMTGVEGRQDMTRMLDALRQSPPKTIGGLTVTSVEDLQDEAGKLGAFKGGTDKAARNFLIFRLDGAGGFTAKVCLRPSGTEPKAKAYLEVATPPCPAGSSDGDWAATCAKADGLVSDLANDFLAQALGTVGQKPKGPAKLSR